MRLRPLSMERKTLLIEKKNRPKVAYATPVPTPGLFIISLPNSPRMSQNTIHATSAKPEDRNRPTVNRERYVPGFEEYWATYFKTERWMPATANWEKTM